MNKEQLNQLTTEISILNLKPIIYINPEVKDRLDMRTIEKETKGIIIADYISNKLVQFFRDNGTAISIERVPTKDLEFINK